MKLCVVYWKFTFKRMACILLANLATHHKSLGLAEQLWENQVYSTPETKMGGTWPGTSGHSQGIPTA